MMNLHSLIINQILTYYTQVETNEVKTLSEHVRLFRTRYRSVRFDLGYPYKTVRDFYVFIINSSNSKKISQIIKHYTSHYSTS
jgi:hypothetical protein